MSPLDLKRKKELSKFTAASLGASMAFFFATQLLTQFIAAHPDDPSVPWLAALPGIALAAIAVLAMRSLRRMDELERKMHMEAMAFAFLGSILLVCGYVFLAAAELITPPLFWLIPAMVMCWVIGLVLAVERYR